MWSLVAHVATVVRHRVGMVAKDMDPTLGLPLLGDACGRSVRKLAAAQFMEVFHKRSPSVRVFHMLGMPSSTPSAYLA